MPLRHFIDVFATADYAIDAAISPLAATPPISPLQLRPLRYAPLTL